MSWGCLNCLRWPVGRRTVTWFPYTLSFLPGTIIRRARTSSTPPSSPAPGIRTSIKGEKHGRFLSLRCHIINSGVSGMFAVFMQVDWRNRGSEECTRDGASHFTESGRSISRDRVADHRATNVPQNEVQTNYVPHVPQMRYTWGTHCSDPQDGKYLIFWKIWQPSFF